MKNKIRNRKNYIRDLINNETFQIVLFVIYVVLWFVSLVYFGKRTDGLFSSFSGLTTIELVIDILIRIICFSWILIFLMVMLFFAFIIFQAARLGIPRTMVCDWKVSDRTKRITGIILGIFFALGVILSFLFHD